MIDRFGDAKERHVSKRLTFCDAVRQQDAGCKIDEVPADERVVVRNE